MAFTYINGVFYEDSEAKISVKDRGFRFGDGLFETVAMYNGKIHQWNLHQARLDGGLNALKIIFNSERLESDIKKTFEKNGLKSGLARVTVTRGEGSRGYLPTENSTANVVIEAMPRPPMEREYAKLCVSKYRKIPLECLPVNYKLTQGLNSTLAKMEAHEKGFFEAILLNEKGNITECTAGNIFWVKGNTIYTPCLKCGLLDGTIRHLILEQNKFKVVQRKFKLKELKKADEIFITNVAWRVLFVDEVEDIFQKKKDNKISKAIKALVEHHIDNM